MLLAYKLNFEMGVISETNVRNIWGLFFFLYDLPVRI